MNFMELSTIVSDYIEKINQQKNKIGASIADAVVDRIRSGKVNEGMKKDILNSIKEFSDADKVDILLACVLYLAANAGSMNRNTSVKPERERSKKSDFFGR